MFKIGGGFTTNGTGDITLTTGLASVTAVIVMAETTGPYFFTRISGAPTGYAWVRAWDANQTPPRALLNTFIVLDAAAW